MEFAAFKVSVIRLARREGVGYLVPSGDQLFREWERGTDPARLVASFKELDTAGRFRIQGEKYNARLRGGLS
jgi:hypothetical protein